MRNGDYELVVAPADYPGLKYRGRYIYEHHLVWWENTGAVVQPGHLVHHKDGNHRHNGFDNLELKSWGQHTGDHNVARRRLVHGTLNAYTHHKCRCDECRTKHSAWSREWRYRTGRRVKGRKPGRQKKHDGHRNHPVAGPVI